MIEDITVPVILEGGNPYLELETIEHGTKTLPEFLKGIGLSLDDDCSVEDAYHAIHLRFGCQTPRNLVKTCRILGFDAKIQLLERARDICHLCPSKFIHGPRMKLKQTLNYLPSDRRHDTIVFDFCEHPNVSERGDKSVLVARSLSTGYMLAHVCNRGNFRDVFKEWLLALRPANIACVSDQAREFLA